MDGRLRRVSQLRLRSRNESLNRRGAILIEDALRTASLPDADGGRLWVVRKLALGRIRAGDPPSTVALRIEARFREAGASAVHAESPLAAAAGTVYFDNDLEPYTALALRLARGIEPAAWFWPLAARGWTPGLPRDESMRVLLAGALASSAGPIAALALVRALVRHGVLDVLAGALQFPDGPGLLRAFGWPEPRAELQFALATERPVDAPSPALERMAAPWFAAWGNGDARSLWLACALYAVERPALAAHPSLPAKAAAWIAAVRDSTSVDLAAESLPENAVPPALALTPPDAAVADPSIAVTPPAPLAASGLPASQIAEPASPSLAPELAPVRLESPAPPSPEPRSKLFTSRAGLFFLIPILQRLGMPQWLADHPEFVEWSVPYLVLRHIAMRLDTLPEDPVLIALGELPDELPADVRTVVDDWVRRVRQFSRRTARMGLHTVVCRPGRIHFTETHIDVLFRLDRADIRIRRAGLDIDPGWMPWLGRVIHFHYLSDEVYDG